MLARDKRSIFGGESLHKPPAGDGSKACLVGSLGPPCLLASGHRTGGGRVSWTAQLLEVAGLDRKSVV